jgi:hypothetical protein
MAVSKPDNSPGSGGQPGLGSGLANFKKLATQNEQWLQKTQEAAMIHDTNKAALQKTV